jgi:hypothetical protein
MQSDSRKKNVEAQPFDPTDQYYLIIETGNN